MQSPKSKRAAVGLACCLVPLGTAVACPVLQDGINLVSGSSDFQVAEGGSITISFDTVSGGSIADTEFSLYAAPGYVGSGTFVGSLVGVGDLSIPVLPATKYIVDLTSVGPNGSTTRTLDVDFQPGGASAVPLPASWLLLLSGSGLVLRRRLAGTA